ncbi:MAG TPA: squalene/phytoene synthase family protein [Micavibrio sp.]|nr:squalene/phytoene synthase family protein [Micavibrio sp.]
MDASFLAADLKKADPDRHLLSLFTPRRSRAPLWALFLLKHEIARTRSMVSNTQLGLIRLQWWRDEIARLYRGGDGGEIPILSTLAPAIRERELPQDLFETLIFAHEFDLEDVPPENFDGLKNYADFTTTPLNKLALKILGEEAPEEEIRTISMNLGLSEILRSVPLRLSERRFYLPRQWLDEKDLTPECVIDFNYKQELVQCIERAISSIAPYRKPKSRFLALTQRLTFIYLDKIKKCGFDVFDSKMRTPPAFLALRLALSLR